MLYRFFKRMLDITLSLLGIVVLIVPMFIVAIIIKIDSPGPVFFKQKRDICQPVVLKLYDT